MLIVLIRYVIVFIDFVDIIVVIDVTALFVFIVIDVYVIVLVDFLDVIIVFAVTFVFMLILFFDFVDGLLRLAQFGYRYFAISNQSRGHKGIEFSFEM